MNGNSAVIIRIKKEKQKMNIRLYDLFDYNFTVAKYSDVEGFDGDGIYFIDGTFQPYDSEFVGVEEIA